MEDLKGGRQNLLGSDWLPKATDRTALKARRRRCETGRFRRTRSALILLATMQLRISQLEIRIRRKISRLIWVYWGFWLGGRLGLTDASETLIEISERGPSPDFRNRPRKHSVPKVLYRSSLEFDRRMRLKKATTSLKWNLRMSSRRRESACRSRRRLLALITMGAYVASFLSLHFVCAYHSNGFTYASWNLQKII